MARDEIVAYVEGFAASFGPPLRLGSRVTAVRARADGGYLVETDGGSYQAANVIVAAGYFHQPRLPAWVGSLPAGVTTLHTSQYQKPQSLPDGAVLVAGCGQSGAQIAEELVESGRRVFVAVGQAGWAPRRYRGRDIMRWAVELGMFDTPLDKMPSPEVRFAANPQISGKGGGRTVHHHTLAGQGAILMGRLLDYREGRLQFGQDLHQSLTASDEFADMFLSGIDKYVNGSGRAAPPAEEQPPRHGYRQEPPAELELEAEGINTIIWATGYRWDFSWVELPVFNERGYPIQQQGATDLAGLYFLGLNWLHTNGSSLFYGVGKDAAHIAAHLTARERAPK
jgi:putative flavoprotein involved in K+ transport